MKEKLINALAEALEMEPSQIKQLDTFRDYENYSSLTELSVLAMLDSDFGVEIEMEEFNKYKTVDNLIHLVSGNSSK
jgi:acyl carrier protein